MGGPGLTGRPYPPARACATAAGAASGSAPDEAAVHTTAPRERPAQWSTLLDQFDMGS
jgi:hypothetical protein